MFSDQAVDFIENVNTHKPFFNFVSYFAPHGPWTPPGRYADKRGAANQGTPAFLEKDVSDKPRWIRHSRRRRKKLRENRLQHKQALLAVDDGVEQIFDALEERASSTTRS